MSVQANISLMAMAVVVVVVMMITTHQAERKEGSLSTACPVLDFVILKLGKGGMFASPSALQPPGEGCLRKKAIRFEGAALCFWLFKAGKG